MVELTGEAVSGEQNRVPDGEADVSIEFRLHRSAHPVSLTPSQCSALSKNNATVQVDLDSMAFSLVR